MAGNRYTGTIHASENNSDVTAGMAPKSLSQVAATVLDKQTFKQWKKLVDEGSDYAKKAGEKLIDLLYKGEHKKLLDFEKTKKQKRDEAYQDRLEQLRAEYLLAQENEDKLAIQRQINAEKSHKINSEFASKLGKSVGNAIGGAISKAVSNMDEYIGTYSQYMASISTRLYGSDKSFSGLTGLIKRNIGISPYVKQTAVLENLSKLVEQGIAYNVEQRAFLATVSDRIATTFDAFDSNLLQLIRLQQSDSTAARLGIESSLTKFLNETFGDTSYLSDVSSNISKSLLGVESQLGLKGGVEFESTVQKWLGSLYSVGVSAGTLEQIAAGLNYLGTGDISSLSSNEALQRLLTMSAQRSGISYGRMLTGGLNAESANKLLENLVLFGQEIARSDNQVVRSQYANIFGLTISDMTALLNLSSKDLSSIASNMQTYSDAISETTNRLASIGSRTSLKDKVEIAFSNVLAGIGETIASSGALYGTYLASNALISAGDITIPSVSVFGFSTPEIKVGQTAKTGVVVGAGLASLLGAIGNLLSGNNGTSMRNWNASETRGGGTPAWGYTGINVATLDDLSYSGYLGMSTDSDIYAKSLLAQKEVNVIEGRTQEITDILNEQVVNQLARIIIALTEEGVKVQVSADTVTNSAGL